MAMTVGGLLAGAAVGFMAGSMGKGGQAVENPAPGGREAKVARGGAVSPDGREIKVRREVRTYRDAMGEVGQLARLQSLIDLYAGMGPAQLQAEAQNLEGLPMGERILASMLLFSRWGEVDPLGALEFSKSMGYGGMFARPTVLRSWASVDPVNAAKYYSESSGDVAPMAGFGRGGSQGPEVIAREWAKLDPKAALVWAESLEGSDRGAAIASVVGQMALNEPAEAARVAGTLEGPARRDALTEVAKSWAGKDFSAAEAWMNSLPDDDRGPAMEEALAVLATRDPLRAADKVAAMASGEFRDGAIKSVASSWSRTDPAAAATWLLKENPKDATESIREVMVNWVGQDKAGALQFINGQEPGSARDSAVQTYLWTDRRADPTEAIALAESLSEDRSKVRMVEMTASRWMQEDEVAAKAYLERTSVLDEDAKARVLSGDHRQEWRGRRRH